MKTKKIVQQFFLVLKFIIIMFGAISYAQTAGQSYYIQSGLGNNYLDVKWANTANGTPLHLWNFNGGSAQKFTLENAGNGYFYIKSALGKYIHVENNSDKTKALALIWTGKGNDNTKWKFKSTGKGSFYIQSKKGTYLEVKSGTNSAGTPIWMASLQPHSKQQWKLMSAIGKIEMTTFNPTVNGFRFGNNFKSTVGDAGSIKLTFNGLCGGMSYAANDYFLNGISTPIQDFTPAIGSRLHNYIYERQQNSFANIDKFLEFTVNPFGWGDREFFYWGLEGRLYDLKRKTDSNRPIPLGLFSVHNDPSSHHQVLAIGYSLGKYTGKKDKDPYEKDVRIFIYDPNHPTKTSMLVPVPKEAAYHEYVGSFENGMFAEHYKSKKKWRSYFLDNKYRNSTPPRIKMPNISDKKKINRLLFTVGTGRDDLRGGHDNVHFHIYFKDGSQQTVLNANKKRRWPDNHDQNVEVYLDKAVKLNDIVRIKLQTTFGGGPFGDNWNMDKLAIRAISGNNKKVSLYWSSGTPLKRFTGDHQWFTIDLSDL